MSEENLWNLFINASLINNFVLAYFLGICPFLGVSGKLATATRMGAAVSFVMLIASICAYGIQHILSIIEAPYLQLISFIVVIATTVQLVEMFVRKVSENLYDALGIFLPLITTNCAILAVALFQSNRGYHFAESVVFALGAGAGFTLALILMAGIRQKLELADPPAFVQGTALTLIIAGILSLTFMGFAGISF